MKIEADCSLGSSPARAPHRLAGLGAAVLLCVAVAACSSAPKRPPMSFFVTSVGSGNGGNLGGLAGADAHCQKLAAAAGAGQRTWRAYLSTQSGPGVFAVHARDRIGNGPWINAKGAVVARSLDDLHASTNNLTKATALTEKGEAVKGRGDQPNQHDVLTGSQPDGTAFGNVVDRTCGNWTSAGAGSAMVGHHDRLGLRDDEPSRSWNASHPSRACDVAALNATGGNGYFYCFAAK
jgi:hypothetical protein